ncbi:hypothetical protein [Streptomyces sp. NPDC097619]|uniref:hypothetical protein n=1 Tax=Streptomyces sp. NPDC097619 TaxID=3157228 RepID=UPI00332D8513
MSEDATSTLPATDVRTLARRVVLRTAPGEEPYFDAMADAWFAAGPRGARRAGRRTPTSFSPADAVDLVVLATPVVLTVLSGAASDLLADWLRTAARPRRRWWRRRRGVPGNTPVVAPADLDWSVWEPRIAAAAARQGMTVPMAAAFAAALRAECTPEGATAPVPEAAAPRTGGAAAAHATAGTPEAPPVPEAPRTPEVSDIPEDRTGTDAAEDDTGTGSGDDGGSPRG